MIMLEYPDSIQSKQKKEAEKELKKFQNYLLKCVSMDLIIINPYGEMFKRNALHSEVPKRELKQSMELFDSYCKLTYFDCDKYKLGGTSADHDENVFFRISDIRRQYSRYKSYKNIDNVKGLIHRLVQKGYIDSIDYQDGKQNIYYLTEQCKDIAIPFELTETDKKSAEEFLKKVGVSN